MFYPRGAADVQLFRIHDQKQLEGCNNTLLLEELHFSNFMLRRSQFGVPDLLVPSGGSDLGSTCRGSFPEKPIFNLYEFEKQKNCPCVQSYSITYVTPSITEAE